MYADALDTHNWLIANNKRKLASEFLKKSNGAKARLEKMISEKDEMLKMQMIQSQIENQKKPGEVEKKSWWKEIFSKK